MTVRTKAVLESAFAVEARQALAAPSPGLMQDLLDSVAFVADLAGYVPLEPAEMGQLDQTISAAYAQAEVQAISDKVDAIIVALTAAGLFSAPA